MVTVSCCHPRFCFAKYQRNLTLAGECQQYYVLSALCAKARPPHGAVNFPEKLRYASIHSLFLIFSSKYYHMEYLLQFVDLFLHLDKHLTVFVEQYGTWTYLALFIIVFCETGLVVTPFLPGDSLLFAAGAIASLSNTGINAHSLALLLIVAAVLGDAVNYFIGSILGMKVFENKNSKIFKRSYLEKTQAFYEKYGSKTIVIARFVPIVRTFAPFLAGVSSMTYKKFATFNVVGALLWVILFVYAGYFFGGVELVKKNFTLVILAIIFISILPIVFEVYKSKKAQPAN